MMMRRRTHVGMAHGVTWMIHDGRGRVSMEGGRRRRGSVGYRCIGRFLVDGIFFLDLSGAGWFFGGVIGGGSIFLRAVLRRVSLFNLFGCCFDGQ